MLFKVGQYLVFIIAHNYILCAIIGGIVGIIENTIFLYFYLLELIGAFNVFIRC